MSLEIQKPEAMFPLIALRYWCASLISRHVSSDSKRARMIMALKTIEKEADDEIPGSGKLDLAELAHNQLKGEENDAQKIAILVELRAVHCFHPHLIEYKDEAVQFALTKIAHNCEVPLENVDKLEKFYKEAVKGFSPGNGGVWFRRAAGAALMAAVAAFVVATAGAGAPAVTALLAALGGGSVAAGGFGMVGGVVVLVMGSATGSVLLSMTGKLLTQLGPEGLRAELIKLEVTQRLWWYEGVSGVPSRREVLERQRQLLGNIKELWETEKKISDKNSAPVKSWQKMHELVELSIKRFDTLP